MGTTSKQGEIRRLECLLGQIRDAISHIAEGGQSVVVGDVSYTEANFKALAEYEKSTRRDLARLNGSRPTFLRVNLSGVPR